MSWGSRTGRYGAARWTHLMASAVVAAALAVAGCGGEDLTVDEQGAVAGYENAFAQTALNGGRYGKTLEGVDYIIDLHRRAPDSETLDGRTMTEVLRDAAATLDPSEPELVRELERELE